MENKNSSLDIDQNIAGALSYVLGFVTGIIFYLLEQKNEFVRFHAVQSTMVFGIIFIISVLLSIVGGLITLSLSLIGLPGFFNLVLGPFFGLMHLCIFLISLILWIVLIVKAYQNERYKLPLIGTHAESLSTGNKGQEG